MEMSAQFLHVASKQGTWQFAKVSTAYAFLAQQM
jgi:hypothetical protein